MTTNKIFSKLLNKSFLIPAMVVLFLSILAASIGLFFALKTDTLSTDLPSSSTITNTSSSQEIITNTITPTVSVSISLTSESTSYKTFIENTQKWSISYPQDWSSSKQNSTSNNPGVSYYINFKSSETNTDHQGLFSVNQISDGYIHGSYDECKNNPKGGAGLGHTSTDSIIYKVNGYDACEYTETSGDGSNVILVNTYTFIKDSKTEREITLSYAEDSYKNRGHNYPTNQWVYTNKFNDMVNSFKFI